MRNSFLFTRFITCNFLKILTRCSSQMIFDIIFRGAAAMFSLDELEQNVASFRDGSLAFAEFYRWFEENDSEATEPELRAAAEAVENAISAYFFDDIGESGLRQLLAMAVVPFALSHAAMPVLATASSTIAREALPRPTPDLSVSVSVATPTAVHAAQQVVAGGQALKLHLYRKPPATAIAAVTLPAHPLVVAAVS